MPLDKSYLQGQTGQRLARGWQGTGPTQESPFPLQARIGYRTWAAPLAASTTQFQTAQIGPVANVTQTIVRVGPGPFPINTGGTINGTPFLGTVPAGTMDWPRNVVVTVTHASAIVGPPSGIIYGADEFNRLISETWSVTVGGTSKTYTGSKAFARVDGFTISGGAVDISSDSFALGTGSVLGLPWRNAVAGVGAAVKETMDGTLLTTGTLTAAGTGAVNDAMGTYLPATVPNAAHNYEVWFLINDPQS